MKTVVSWAIITPLLLILVAIPTVTYASVSGDLISKASIVNRQNQGILLLDRHGTPYFQFYDAKVKGYTPLSQIPESLQQAIIAAEDKTFYEHPGFSIQAIVGSLIADIKTGSMQYGGSTITQQLVKNSLLSPEKTLTRKYQELILARELEQRYSKDDILEMYLNTVYYGEGAFGIAAASEAYFDKTPQDLNLAESALLAGLLTSPSKLSPISGDAEAAYTRQHYILGEMVQQKFITQEQAKLAEQTKFKFAQKTPQLSYQAPHFALMVRQQLIDTYGEDEVAQSGLVVQTSIDLEWQKYAEQVIAKQVNQLQRNRVSNGGAVIMDVKTGEVRALVGSQNWDNNKFGKVNIVTSPRQPGSTFKPIVYAAAFEKQLITPASPLIDKPTTFTGNYKPENYDKRFRGTVLARRALANSLNVPSVEVMNKVGLNNALEMAQRLGVTDLKTADQYGLSLVLGSGEVSLLEMTNVYATLANQGQRVTPTLITRIEDRTGKPIYQYQPEPTPVLDPRYAFLITSILSDPSARREVFGSTLDTAIKAAVKTGTSEDYRDSLTIGYTPHIAVGVWVGNNDGQPMDKVAGSLGAAPIWKQLITHYSDHQTVAFTPPSGVISLTVCANNGMPTTEATSSAIKEYFAEGSQPRGKCNLPKPPTATPSAAPTTQISLAQP